MTAATTPQPPAAIRPTGSSTSCSRTAPPPTCAPSGRTTPPGSPTSSPGCRASRSTTGSSGCGRGLTDAELEAFTVLDYRDRMAFVVETAEDASGGRRLAGVGRYERSLPGGDAAEVAFSVADESQGRGVASRILEYLTAYARTQGISAFEAYVMADNHAMIRVFRGAGFTMSRQLDEGIYRIEFPTEESDETRAATEEHEKRAAAASVTPLLYPTSVAVIGASRDPGVDRRATPRQPARRRLHRAGVPGEPQGDGGPLDEGLRLGARHRGSGRPGGDRGACAVRDGGGAPVRREGGQGAGGDQRRVLRDRRGRPPPRAGAARRWSAPTACG